MMSGKRSNEMLTAITDIFHQLGVNRTYWIAYSGGLDSHVLLDLCYSALSQFPIQFKVIHIHHGISSNADAWSLHCENICKAYSLPFFKKAVNVIKREGESLEELARDARYAAFKETMQADDVLLTAHHQDDQAETVLLQLFRGAGLKGLSAMPAQKSFAQGLQVRPLLNFSRDELEAYAREHNLKWIEDESNYQTHFMRNHIRHDIFPLLKTRWPSIQQTIARSAFHCAEAQALLEEFALSEWQQSKGIYDDTLSVNKLLRLTPAKQRLVLKTWIQHLGHPQPDVKKLETIRTDVLQASWDRKPLVKWGETELRRYRDDLYLMSALVSFQENEWTWDLSQPFSLSGMGVLHAIPQEHQGLKKDIRELSIRFRRGGESMRWHGITRSLKNLFQEWDVPPWERDRTPLLYWKDKLIGVVGYGLDQDYCVGLGEMGLVISKA